MPTSRPAGLPAAWLQRLRRINALLSSRKCRRLVAAGNVLVLLVAVAPFAIWEGLGPARFEDVDLGQRPDLVPAPTEALDDSLPEPEQTEVTAEVAWIDTLPYDLSPTTTVTLVFSVGSRDVSAEEAERLNVHDLDERHGDGLTDTMMLLVADRATRQVALLSVPRDLWMHARDHRINATFSHDGTQAFVDDVSRTTGLPIHHIVQVNFAAFARLVDAIGGVALQVDRPLADVPAVLYVPEAGCWHFDGTAALAWARSRHTLTRRDGEWVTDASASDFGRIERQQALLGAIWDQVRSPSLLTALPDLLAAARGGLVVDEGLGVQDLRDLLSGFADVAAGRVEGYTLPTDPQWIQGAAAQVIDRDEATGILARLRTWPPEQPRGGAWGRVTPAPDPPLLAAPAGMALPSDQACTISTARHLPDPHEPLYGVAASRGEVDPGPRPDSSPTQDTDQRPPPTGQPGPPARPDEPAGPPSGEPSPSPSPTDDPLIDLPLPG